MKFKNLAALVALSVCSSVALAQTTVNDTTNATSGSASNSDSAAINKTNVVSGNSTSGSSSDSTSNSGAISVSKGGGAQVTGGNAASTAAGGQGGGGGQGGASQQGQMQGQQQGQQANNANNVAPSQNTTITSTAPDHITQDIHTSGSTTVKTVPSVVVPNLPSVINNDMCIISAAVGGSGIGFSVGIGLQYKDDDCIRRINARQLYNMGYQKAALALMAQDASISKALQDAGYSNLGEPLPPSQPDKLVQLKQNPKSAVEEKVITKPYPRSLNEYEPNPVKYDQQPLVDPSKI